MEAEKVGGSNVIRVKLMKQKKNGLGFLVRKRSKTPHVVVSDLVSHGTAAESGLVQIGDVILKVNDVSFENLEYEKSLESLKSLPVNTPVVLILKGPEGYTSHLETRFSPDGVPKTIRITKPILHNDGLISRIKKTFSTNSNARACRTKQTQINCECHKSAGEHETDNEHILLDAGISHDSVDNSYLTSGFQGRPKNPTEANEARKLDENSILSLKSKVSNDEGNLPNDLTHNNNSLKNNATGGEISELNGDGYKSCRGNSAKTEGLLIDESNNRTNVTSFVNGESRVQCNDSSRQRLVDNKRSSNISDDISVFIDEDQSMNDNEIKTIGETQHAERGSKLVPTATSNTDVKMVRQNGNITTESKAGPALNKPVNGHHISECNNMNGAVTSLEIASCPGSRRPSEDAAKIRRTLDVDVLERTSSASGKNSPVKKFVKLRNVAEERPMCSDTLHLKSIEPMPCNANFCMGSVMDVGLVTGEPRPKEEVLVHARDFINQYYQSIKRSNTPAHTNRWTEVEKAVLTSGTYELTTAELTFGAKTAWRNAPRCIGRIQWSKLQVFDARHITTARGMFEAICNHIKYGTNKGNIRSAITVFPPRTDGKHDFRVWNQQFIRYAGYKQEDGSVVGDPSNVELTQVCQKLGWKGKGTRFDVLPLVLQANGHDPELFEIPPELILEVHFKHPKFPWFADMGLRWYALPAVSSMVFDCGGLLFVAAPFNGWFMGTEIGARDLCDPFRYNLLEDIAKRIGFDTRKSSSLWKDRTLVEVNVAVLHSFQSQGVTITDHHAASDSFMKHLDNEQKLRGGCPADWVWIVPPMSGSLLPVFHQEMLAYKLKPSYEYQTDAWKTHVWKKDKERTRSSTDRPRRKIGFRELARAVKFSAKLMGKALARRVKCVILYATETGKSEGFAKTLCQIFKHAFDARVCCMDDYDVTELEHEALVLIVTSTFGNGDPPENGESFAKYLLETKHPDTKDKLSKQLSYLRLSVSEPHDIEIIDAGSEASDDTFKSLEDNLTLETGPLSNVRFSVFGLGSSAYPNFCAFAHYLDKMFANLGAERINEIAEGDELCGQEESFRTWATEVFKAACETFCTGDDRALQDAAGTLSKTDHNWTPDTFRVTPATGNKEPEPITALSTIHNKNVVPCRFMERTQLQAKESDRQTMLIKLDATLGSGEMLYHPGDHVAIFSENAPPLVDAILMRLHNAPPPEQLIKIEVMNERSTPLGNTKSWDPYPRLPVCTLHTAFLRYLDITTPPSQALLKLFATQASKDCDKESLENLTNDSHIYEEWKYETYPNVVQVLDQFPSLRVPASLLLTQLPLLQSRFYSISSSLKSYPGEIHATVAVVKYKTQGGNGALHEGVCSNWLNRREVGDTVPCLIRHAPAFHMPDDPTVPIILVGPGTGIAPFRSFWQQRKIDREMNPEPSRGGRKGWGEIHLYFGCRNSEIDAIYREELEQMKAEGVLTQVYTALSREKDVPKTYVQSILKQNSTAVFRCIVKQSGHFYVCGDVKMASDVTATLEKIVATEGNMASQDAKSLIMKLRDNSRFHEDIFGVTLRSSEVTDRARDQAKRAWSFVNAAGRNRASIDTESVSPIPTGDYKGPKSKPKAPRSSMFSPDSMA
ncbi:nitric oxide synthase-like protein [Mya arenaria]|uniref:nitric oxide synthase-like protein n=1 Tax=Mya arenaria TaxID=6604 RepID=UPI0022E0F8CF|nr:nitric oxide synthase-like protein [Mya arenaria]